jgi:DNA-binding CsgD family transcriptional regulator
LVDEHQAQGEDRAGDEPALVGREPELNRLAKLIDDARRGSGGALVLRGAPGVGKTRLLGCAADMGADLLILHAGGVQTESDLAYATLAGLLGPLGEELGRLPAWHARALRAAIGLDSSDPQEGAGCRAALLGLLAQAAEHAALLILVDDLQWVDAASREAILFAARRLTGDPIAFVIGIRDVAEFDRELGLPELLLSGLAQEPGLALLAQVHEALEPPLARQLWRQTAGNPLALLEIPRHLPLAELAGRLDRDEPLPVSERLVQAFRQRVQRLAPATQQALLLAAASYTGAVDAVLSALAAEGLDSAVLDPAEAAGLLTLDGEALRWRHPLVRFAIYQAAPSRARRAAHARLARASGEGRLLEHRVWHQAAATAGTDETVARELEHVAAEAVRRGAVQVALPALRRAARLTPAESERARRELAAADLAVTIGRWEEALELLDDARGHTADPRLIAAAERTRARVEMSRGSPWAAHDRLVAIADAIVSTDRALAAAAMTEAVLARTTTGPLDAYRATAQRAYALACGQGDEIEAMAGIALGCGLMLNGETAAGQQLFDRYGPLVTRGGVWRAMPELAGMYACLHASIERFEEAERLFTSMLADARAAGATRMLPYPLSGRALLNLELGRWPAALAAAEEAVELARELVGPGMLASSLAALAQVEAALGRVSETRAHAEQALAICKHLNAWAVEPEPVLALASLALSLGEHEAAVAVWRQTSVDIREWVAEPGWEHLDDVMIEASLRAGQEAQAERELADLEAKAQRTGRTWAHAVAARCRGLLALTEEFDDAFRQALEWHRRAPLPFAMARTELCYGERLRRSRRRSDAGEQLTHASDTFHRLGARVWAQRADRELAAAGYPRRSPVASSPWIELTAAETRVAQIILEGATYREAARTLVVSPRTIESHLRQIYRKVGVRSRGELVRRLAV